MVDYPQNVNALTTSITIRCPICDVRIPAPHIDTVDGNQLSVTLDLALVNEHIHMHTRCTCAWDRGHILAYVSDCPIHA